MRKMVLALLFCCMAATALQAQNALVAWEKGPLTWDNFTTVDSSLGSEHSYLEFLLDVEYRPYSETGFLMQEVAVAYMDKDLSWVDINYCTPEELLYNQVLFNLVELQRRHLQLAIDTNGFKSLDYHIRRLSYVADSFCIASRYGADVATVVKWGTKVRRQLDSLAPIVADRYGRKKALPNVNVSVSRAWEKGPLTWSHFTPVDEGLGHEHSYLEYSLEIENRRNDIDGIIWPVKTAVARMYKLQSWVDSNHRTDAQLHYNQVLFNMVELYRRHLQVAIDTGGSARPDSVLAKIRDRLMRSLSYETGHYCRATRYGNDTAAVNRWDHAVRQRMDSITPLMVESHAPELVLPKYSLPFVVGTNFGLGFKYFGGELTPLFAPSGGGYWDFELGYSRNILTLGMYAGGGRCKPDTLQATDNKNTLYSTDNIGTLGLHADYGFAVVDSRSLRIMPFVGYGMQGFFYSDEDEESSGGPVEGCWRAGVDVKYHFSNEFTASRRVLEQYFASVDAKVYVSRDRFNSIVGAPRGFTVNLCLGLSLLYKEGKAKGPGRR